MSTVPTTTLYEFPLSHFCEKARWALDHHGVDYDVVALMPGLQARTLRKLGVAARTVPVVVSAGQAIQGSGALIDWLDARNPARSLTPADPTLAAEARALEETYDRVFGDDLRRVAYHHLLDHPEVVVPMWTTHAPWWGAPLYRMGWKQVRTGLRKLYRMRPERVVASQDALEAALDDLDARLADGRTYLVGDQISRADIAACALLSPLLQPPERPWQSPVAPPASLVALVDGYRQRPSWQWALARYAQDRRG